MRAACRERAVTRAATDASRRACRGGRAADDQRVQAMGWFDDNHWAGEAYDFGFGYMCGGRADAHAKVEIRGL